MASSFVRNNIRYRSAASKALEGYYNSKAFILNELVTQENGFGENAKEILLLLFNKHADWLFHTETLLLDKSSVSEQDVVSMQMDLQAVTDDVTEILQEHTEVFDQEYVRHWLHVHKQKFTVLVDMIKDVEGMTQIIAFPYATECLVEYLNSTLFELYELDCLLGSNVCRTKLSTNESHPHTLILHIDDVSVQYSSLKHTSAELERVAYYEQHILDRRSKIDIRVRDYVVRANSEQPRSEVLSELKQAILSKHWVKELEIVNPNAEKSQLI